jgi:nitrogen fixation protein NifU and related proteins
MPRPFAPPEQSVAMDELNELYQEVILDHQRNPRNFRAMPDADRKAEGNNPLCGDHFTVFLKLDGDVMREVTFQGAGCAISKASGSMMTDLLKGKTIAEAKKYFAEFQEMVTTGKTDEEKMGKLCAFCGVHHFPMRVKCATLPWHALMASFKGDATISTEEENPQKPA